MNRLRVRFKRGEEIKYISHLDIIRLWQRSFRRAGIALAYSEGFNPHPRLALASPLALGVTSEAELMDIYLEHPMSAASFTTAVAGCLPPGLEIMQAVAVAPLLPSMQSQLRQAEYRVRAAVPAGFDIQAAVTTLMQKESLPWQHQRDTGIKSYDLRKLVEEIRLCGEGEGEAVVDMRLRCDSAGSGRPEQVLKALGLGAPLAVHRTRLILQTY
jgi:radical SAM-linked protein